MHILLVAYDFPPTPSPQALRWAYLARELARAGNTVEVIAPDIPGYGAGGLPQLPDSVIVHPVAPGRVAGLLLGRKGREKSVQGVGAPELSPANQGSVEKLNWKGRLRKRIEGKFENKNGLNWKGQLAELIKKLVSSRRFPDYRVEWVPEAVKVLEQVVAKRRPEVVVVSHEPACSLPVGLAAFKLGLPLVADMGDPVLAPYTPEKWRKAAFKLESQICRAASLVSVTTEAAATLLQERHGLAPERILLLRQGYDPDFVATEFDREIDFSEEWLELLYTGSFYSFRRADVLINAVSAVPGVRLTVATINAPDYLQQAAAAHPESIRLVGYLPHRSALAAQRECDVLVNLANADPVQVPGKLFEYFGAAKHVLHLRGAQQDATGALIVQLAAGTEMATELEPLIELLKALLVEKKEGGLPVPALDVKPYAWNHLARQWSLRVETALRAETRSAR